MDRIRRADRIIRVTLMDCPDARALADFAVGALTERRLDEIAAHVEACAACTTSLEHLDHERDGLLEQLHDLRTRQPGDDTPPAVLARARAAAADAGLVIDAGRAMARRLQDGPCRLGKFELLEEVGCGSFGTVFRARDTELDRIVAIKVPRAGALAGEGEQSRLLREARSAAQLEHPDIVSLYDVGHTDDGACYLVTEFVAGRTLESLLADAPPDPRTAAALVSRIAAALHHAHEHGVVHRDVKPSNIIIDAQGTPHVTDFGLAKRAVADATVTADGEIMGTPAYMSPELAAGDARNVDAGTDVYSLGVILYEMLTGSRPFSGSRRMLMLQILEDDPRPPRKLNEHVPRELEVICLVALEKDRSRRFASAAEMADDLDRFVRGEPIRARSPGAVRRLRHWCRRNPVAASLFLAVTVGSSTGMLYLSSLSRTFVHQTALVSAEMQAEMLEEINTLYSEVVQPLQDDGVDITHEYLQRDGAVPLPATFTIEAGRRISASKTGMQVRLFSDHPFPWRDDGGPQDVFESAALAALRERPDRPYFRFTEVDGKPYLRFAAARRMQPSCIECHNTHPQSPRTDWAVGDVRGVLEIVRPLHKDIALVRSGLGGSFVIVAVVSLALLGLGVLIAVGRRP